jgi:hypothetical protein
MKKTLVLAAIAPLFLAAACASTAGGGSASMAASTPSSGAKYCKKDRLNTAGDGFECNWSSTVADACETSNVNTVKKSAVNVGPNNAGRCSNGAWLVSVQTK